MRYRPEIDGLRAVAVVPVILFHAGVELFGGGFVGVDVFFVISGYLITMVLIEDIESKNFNLLKFYERRARRILPALFFVVLVCIIFAWVIMHPGQMRNFLRSVFFVSLFASNFHFLKESDYFAAGTEESPLLHTWSLAVEEQYYLVFPVFLFLAWRYGRNQVFWSIFALAVVSLAMSEWGWRTNEAANFYLAPTRAWELLSGSLAAFIVSKRGVRASNILSLIGLMAIIFAIFAYDENTPFPSLYALVPVIGVVLIILFASKETLTANILSVRLIVGIGLISYSSYLWHQPLFAFASLASDITPSDHLMLVLSLTSLIFGYLSWRFIEQPFRNMKTVDTRFFLKISIPIFIFLIVFGRVGDKTDAIEELMVEFRFTDSERIRYNLVSASTSYNFYENMYDRKCKFWHRNTEDLDVKKMEECYSRLGRSIVVLGDSHAMNLFNIIAKSNHYDFVIGISQGGCRPHDNHRNCHYDAFEEFVKSQKNFISQILYHQSGSYFARDENGGVDSQLAFEGGFESIHTDNINKTSSFLNELAYQNNVLVSWVGPFLEYRYSPLSVFGQKKALSVNPYSIQVFNEINKYLSNLFLNHNSFNYIKYADVFFEPLSSYIDGCFVFRDTDHYSRCGEDIISQRSNIGLLSK